MKNFHYFHVLYQENAGGITLSPPFLAFILPILTHHWTSHVQNHVRLHVRMFAQPAQKRFQFSDVKTPRNGHLEAV
jgi:hypothetical protein